MTETLHWFAAHLLYEACIGGRPAEEPLFEERIVLVHAPAGVDAAWKKAEKLGRGATNVYQNDADEEVAWTFREVLDVVQLNETSIQEGSEVYHRYLNKEEADSVRESLKSGSV